MDVIIYRTKDINPNVCPYLVDVPVKTNIWIRPDCQKKQFDAIRKAKPSVLFLQSDGGRNEKEWEAIRQNRALFEQGVDWDCTVYAFYAERNYGLYTMGAIVREHLWKEVDRCIYLEDDHIPSVSFFSFCKEMLDKYENDLRICAICGHNHIGVYDETPYDYLFSRRLSIWGIALWRRTFESYNLDYRNDEYVIEAICSAAKKEKNLCRWIRGYAANDEVDGHIPGTEFYLNLDVVAQNQLFIFPKRNMISCMGLSEGAAHAPSDIKRVPKGIAQIFNMTTYELEEPIKHPAYIFPDTEFERRQDRVMGWHHPLVSHYRLAVSILKRLRYGEGKTIAEKAFTKLRGKQHES